MNGTSKSATTAAIYAPTSAGTEGQFLAADANGIPTWVDNPNTDTTYGEATTSVAGLMSSADKTKLDGIATGATANTGTITGITMNGASKGTSGVVDLGTVITSHQDISGKQDKVAKLGSTTKPVYTSAAGTFAECSSYAGGTAVTLNGTSKAANTASLYAPTSSGTKGQVLISSGGEPNWKTGDIIHYVTNPSGTEGSTASGSYNRTQWTGDVDGMTALYTGAMILYKIPLAGNKRGVTLNINNLGEHPVVLNVNTIISTAYTVGVILPLVYDADQTGSVYVDNVATSFTGCWKISNFDSNTTYAVATTSKNGLMSAADKTKLDGIATGATANTGTITGIKMNGASKGTSGVVDLGTVITAHQDISGKVNTSTTVNGHALTGNVSVTKSDVGLGNVTNDSQVKRSEMGAASGVATLDSSGKVPSSQLPSYVDDVIEAYYKAADGKFYTTLSGGTYSGVITGETGKIYVDLSTSRTYRWGGSAYTEIKASPGTLDDITDGSTYVRMTSAERTKLSGIATGATANTGTITKVGNTSSGAVTVSSNNNTASFGNAVTVGSVGGVDLKFTMPGNPNTNTWRPIQVGGTDKLTDSSTKINFAGSGATSVSYSNGTVTISSTDTTTSINGKTGAIAAADIATVLTGAGYKLTDTDTNTTYSAGTGLSLSGTTFALATSGVTAGTYKRVTVDAYGRVTSGDNTDADSWRTVQCNGTSIGNNTLNLKAGSNVSLSNSNGTITISSTDTNTWPTKTSQLTNDSGFLTSHQSLAGYLPLSGGTMSGTINNIGNVGGNIGGRDAIGTGTGDAGDFVIGHNGSSYSNARTLLFDQRYIHLHPCVRIGSYATATTPSYTLDVNGTFHASSDGSIAGTFTAGRAWINYGSNIGSNYSWTGSALTVNSLEIQNYTGTTEDMYPTLTFHQYGYGGPRLSSKHGVFYIYGGDTNSKGLGSKNSYFSEMRIYPNTTGGLYVNDNQVVLTNDSRLSNSRPASDVYSWAKASSKPSYGYGEISYGVNTVTTSGAISLNGTTPLHVVTLNGNASSVALSSNPVAGHSCHVIFYSTA